jgi:acyl-CoA synthetase (AMP-forming)/AMP-acid ligase II
MGCLPFFHIYGMQVIMNTALAAGGTVITMPRFDLVQFLELHQKHGITYSFVAPPIVVALAKHPVVDQYDLSHVRYMISGAAPLSAEVGEEAAARLGCEVVQGYGMTELSPVSHMTPPGGYKPGSVGVTAPNTETAIVDPGTGEFLGIDVDGEVWVRGPQVMKGYLNNPRPPLRRSTTTDGSTPATSATSTPTDTCTWSTGSRSSSSTRASRCHRPSSRRCCSPTRPSPTPP